MSAIVNYSIRVDKLPKEKFIAGKDGAVYLNLTMSINDETRFGNNASCYVAQSREENEAKKKRDYIGNGKVVWNNNVIKNAEKKVQNQSLAVGGNEDDVPF